MLGLKERRLGRALMPLAFAMAMSFAVVACGDSDDGGGQAAASGAPTEEVRATVDAMFEAIGKRDTETICASMAPASRKRVMGFEGHPTCEKAVYDLLTDDATGDPKPSQPARVSRVVVNGGKATVTVTGGGSSRDIPIIRSGDRWLVDMYGGSK